MGSLETKLVWPTHWLMTPRDLPYLQSFILMFKEMLSSDPEGQRGGWT